MSFGTTTTKAIGMPTSSGGTRASRCLGRIWTSSACGSTVGYRLAPPERTLCPCRTDRQMSRGSFDGTTSSNARQHGLPFRMTQPGFPAPSDTRALTATRTCPCVSSNRHSCKGFPVRAAYPAILIEGEVTEWSTPRSAQSRPVPGRRACLTESSRQE